MAWFILQQLQNTWNEGLQWTNPNGGIQIEAYKLKWEAFKLAHKSIMYIEKCVVEMFDDRSKVEWYGNGGLQRKQGEVILNGIEF